MALVAHFNLKLHPIDMKTAFLNENLKKVVYIYQPKGFHNEKGDHLVCKIRKTINGVKYASHQWYIKFHNIVSLYGFT